MSWPTYLCPSRHMRARGRLRHSPGRHICVPARIYVGGPDYLNSSLFRPEIAGSGPAQPYSGRPGPAQQASGAGQVISVRVGRPLLHPGRPIPASPRQQRQAIPASIPGRRRWAAPASLPSAGPPRLFLSPARRRLGLLAGTAGRQATPPAELGHARSTRSPLFTGPCLACAPRLGHGEQALLVLSGGGIGVGRNRASLPGFCCTKSPSQVPRVIRFYQLVSRSTCMPKLAKYQ
jgi:hypothetical protein